MTGRRLLVGIDLAIPVVERLEQTQEELGDALGGAAQLKWRRPEEIRLVLKWLGEVDGAMVEVVVERLREFAQPLFPFQLVSKGLVAGGPGERATWIGAGLDARGEELVGLLQRTLERELMRVGVGADERGYEARAWLGRVRWGHEEVSRALSGREGVLFGSSTIKDLYLMEALPWGSGGGSRVLERVALGAPKAR
jgi:2'-5' RNA ligase